MCSFSHLHPYNILQAHEGEKEMEAGAGFLHVTDTANRLVFFFLVLPQDLLVAVFHIEENFKILPLLSLILTAMCALMRLFFWAYSY